MAGALGGLPGPHEVPGIAVEGTHLPIEPDEHEVVWVTANRWGCRLIKRHGVVRSMRELLHFACCGLLLLQDTTSVRPKGSKFLSTPETLAVGRGVAQPLLLVCLTCCIFGTVRWIRQIQHRLFIPLRGHANPASPAKLRSLKEVLSDIVDWRSIHVTPSRIHDVAVQRSNRRTSTARNMMRIEPLEVRTLPTVNVTVSNGTATLLADQTSHDLTFEQDVNGLKIVANNGSQLRFNGQLVSQVILAGVQNLKGTFGQGADQLDFEDGVTLNNVTLNLGGGANDVEFKDGTITGALSITGGRLSTRWSSTFLA